MNVKAYGTKAAEAPLQQMNIERRGILPNDVEIEILYCGVCHSETNGMALFIRLSLAMKLSAR
jgi:uncharacterized zinc-type alcohol dehydrogenase-like protein